MSNILYVIAIIMVIGWAIGYFIYNVGGLIHIMLFVAVISILLKIVQEK